ncbi:substrate-binding domain-containing protein [Microlunatus sp. Y2014]|uniref:LacI family DNA-binding transcriptional regulator n=1 Tax=Microlunatus sp. Y2014 TaxID=3418488 RepID=UPI003DA6CF55
MSFASKREGGSPAQRRLATSKACAMDFVSVIAWRGLVVGMSQVEHPAHECRTELGDPGQVAACGSLTVALRSSTMTSHAGRQTVAVPATGFGHHALPPGSGGLLMGERGGGVPPAYRREQIIAALQQGRSVTVADLAARFEVSAMTIRRDLEWLGDRGLVHRVHGGAVTTAPREVDRSNSGLATFMIVPAINYHWPAVTAGAQNEAIAQQLRLTVLHSQDYGRDVQARVERIISSSAAGGLILAPSLDARERWRLEDLLQSHDLPVVYVDRASVNPHLERVQTVGVDNRAGGAIAAQHLADLGHTRIAMIIDAAAGGAAARIAGWRETLEVLELPWLGVFDSVPVTAVDSEHRLDQLMTTLGELGVTGVFVSSDAHALRFLQACHDRGIEVPRDMSIVGFDDELATLGTPPLTSVRTPKNVIGHLAVRLLLQAQADGRNHVPQRIALGPRLVCRDSSAPPRQT